MLAMMINKSSHGLTFACGRDYAFSAAGVPATGFSSPNGAAISRKRNVWRLFSFRIVWCAPFRQAGRGNRKVCRCSIGLLTPLWSATPSFNSDGGGFQPQMEHTS